jgi:isopenicillin N synthase-like dioxygenase
VWRANCSANLRDWPSGAKHERIPPDHRRVGDRRARACRGNRQRGAWRRFFYLKGHGIDPALIASVFAGAARFFTLPSEVKERQSIQRSPHNRGYVALKGESLDPARGADLKEAYNIGLDLAADDPRVVRGEPFRGLNLWPDLPGWRATMLAYFDAVWALGRRLHRGIALDLGVDRDFFEDKLDQPMAILRLLHYPPQPINAGPAGIGAGDHSDYGSITLLYTTRSAGWK